MAASSYPTKMSLWALSWGIPPAPQHSCFCCWHGTRDEGQGRRRTSHIMSVPCRTEMFSAHREVRALGHSHPSLNSTLQDHQQAIVSLFPAALTQLSGRISSAGKETCIRDLRLVSPLLLQSTTGRQRRILRMPPLCWVSEQRDACDGHSHADHSGNAPWMLSWTAWTLNLNINFSTRGPHVYSVPAAGVTPRCLSAVYNQELSEIISLGRCEGDVQYNPV